MEGSKTGKGGKSFQDRELAAKVRTLALEEIKKVLEVGNIKGNDLYKPVLLKLAGTVLPRLNEHGGDNGDPIKHEVVVVGMNIINENDKNSRQDNRISNKESETN